jgi:hypothetical protein
MLMKVHCPLNCNAVLEIGQLKSHISDGQCQVAQIYEQVLTAIHTPPWKQTSQGKKNMHIYVCCYFDCFSFVSLTPSIAAGILI